MKVSSLLFLAAFAAVATGAKIAMDKPFLQKAWDILRLLHRIQQHNIMEEQVATSNEYDIEAHKSDYLEPQVVDDFLSMYKKGVILKRGQPLRLLNKSHRTQIIVLFELFFFAKDYATFYKTACWVRERVSGALFIYSFVIALIYRTDTQGLPMPPFREIYPYFFFERTIIQKAYDFRFQDIGNENDNYTHIIYQDFTLLNPEDQLSYFREDILLNTFYPQYGVLYPPWMNYTKYGIKMERYGEQFYYMNSQIYRRYLAERYSNDLPPIDVFEYDKPFKTPYNPKLSYLNGDAVPSRGGNVNPSDFDSFFDSRIQIYEQRVEDAIDFGYLYTRKMEPIPLHEDDTGFELFARIIEGNSVYPEFYGSLFFYYCALVSHIADPYGNQGEPPSAIENLPQTLRDPAYYQIWKRVQHYFDKFKKRLPLYKHEELSFDGVKIDNVEVGKLYTYFEPFVTSLNSVLNVRNLEQAYKLDTRHHHYRLNHKPFTYRIKLTSDKDAQAYVRVFMAPKYDHLGREYDLNEQRNYFFELDRFPYAVKSGKNVIKRNSHESSVVAYEGEGYMTLYRKVNEALEGRATYEISTEIRVCGLPEHLLIPKGKEEGQAYTFFVIISPHEESSEQSVWSFRSFSYCGVGPNQRYPDKKPLEFPFDRPLHAWDFVTPNMYFKDVSIFHKKYEEVETR